MTIQPLKKTLKLWLKYVFYFYFTAKKKKIHKFPRATYLCYHRVASRGRSDLKVMLQCLMRRSRFCLCVGNIHAINTCLLGHVIVPMLYPCNSFLSSV